MIRMNILLAQETDWLKRNPHQQHHLADNLSLRGHKVRVIDYELLWPGEKNKELFSRRQIFSGISKTCREASVTVIRPGIIKVRCLDYISLIFSHKREIKRQISEFAPDVIIGFGILNAHLAMKSSRRNNIPFIYYWIDILHTLIPFKPFQNIAKLVERKTLRKADRVLVINERLKSLVIKMGANAPRTSVVRAGINLVQLEENSADKIRTEYGIEKDDIVLFFMGWLYNFSGLREVALELVKAKDFHLKLLIVGEGDAFNELQAIKEKHDLQNRIILTGKKPYQEIPSFIAASDICLLPAYNNEIMRYIVPIKLYEYMAMEKPVISTKLPGVIKEFAYDNGVVYVNRPEEVVKKASELVANQSLAQLGAKARRFVENYSWDKITDEFENILKEVIKEKRNGTAS